MLPCFVHICFTMKYKRDCVPRQHARWHRMITMIYAHRSMRLQRMTTPHALGMAQYYNSTGRVHPLLSHELRRAVNAGHHRHRNGYFTVEKNKPIVRYLLLQVSEGFRSVNGVPTAASRSAERRMSPLFESDGPNRPRRNAKG